MIKILLIYALYIYIMSFINKKKSVAYCGLIGYSGSTTYNINKLKFIMLWNSFERGKDATGIFTPNTGVIKDSEPAAKFFLQKKIEELQEDNQLIAHVRAKTVGLNMVKNAHPFQFGETVLAHNGTLQDYSVLARKYELKAIDWDVDSQILAHAVNVAFEREGELDFDVLSEYKGAAALLFYNNSTDNIYAYHDDQRTLFFGYDDEGGMYISSIEEPLKALGMHTVQAFEHHTVYTIKNGLILSKEVYQPYEVKYRKEIEEARIAAFAAKKSLGRATKNLKFPKLEKDQRGFVPSIARPYYFVGYWLKSKHTSQSDWSGMHLKGAKTTKDKWYLCTGYFDPLTTTLEMIDDTGMRTQNFISAFDAENFIPNQGDIVMFSTDITSEKGKIELWRKGDMAEVISTDFESAEVLLYSDITRSNFTVPCSFVRLVEPSEIDIIDAEVEVEDEPTESPFIETNDEDNRTETIYSLLKNHREEEVEQTNPTCEITVVDDNSQSTDDEDYIECKLMYALLDRIKKHMNTLEEKYLAEEDVTKEIYEINAVLNLSEDKMYLSSIEKTS